MVLLIILVVSLSISVMAAPTWLEGFKPLRSDIASLSKYTDEYKLYSEDRNLWNKFYADLNEDINKDYYLKRNDTATAKKITLEEYNRTMSSSTNDQGFIGSALSTAATTATNLLNMAEDFVRSSFYGSLDSTKYKKTKGVMEEEAKKTKLPVTRYSDEADFMAKASAREKSAYYQDSGKDWWAWNTNLTPEAIKRIKDSGGAGSYEEFVAAVADPDGLAATGPMASDLLDTLLGDMDIADNMSAQDIVEAVGGGLQLSDYNATGWDSTDPMIKLTDENIPTVVTKANAVSLDKAGVLVLGYKVTNKEGIFFFKSVNYNKLSYKDKKEFMTVTLRSIRETITSPLARSKAYTFIEERDGDMAAAIKLVADETTADLYGAKTLLSGVLNKIGVIMGIISIMIFSLMALTMVMDLAYIVIPGIRLFLDRDNGNKRPFLVSNEAWKSVRDSEKAGVSTSSLGIYFKRRVVLLFILSIMLMLIVTGKMYELMGWIVGTFSRILFV